jgi:ABC-type multidrug transport system fused ATPase/permease subunit
VLQLELSRKARLGHLFSHWSVNILAIKVLSVDVNEYRNVMLGKDRRSCQLGCQPFLALTDSESGSLMANHADEKARHVLAPSLRKCAGEGRLAVVSEAQWRETQEPAADHKGLNVVDFENPGVVPSVRKAIDLLPPKKRKLLLLAAGIQISLGALDLIGIALIGLVAAVAVSGVGGSIGPGSATENLPSWVQSVLSWLGLGGLTISQLAVILALAAVLILVLKTVLSAFMSRRIIRFLANRQADVSVRLAREFLSRPLAHVQRWTTPEAMYALGSGVAAATVSLLGAAITIASEVFLFLIVGVSLFLYDPLLTVICIVLFGIIVLILYKGLGGWTSRNARVMTDASIDTLTVVSEALSTYREATVLNRRDLYVTRYEGLVGRYAGASATAGFILEIPKYVLDIALYLGVLILGVVQFLTKDWTSAAATVALFLAAGSRILPGLLRLQGASITIRNAAVQAQPTFFMSDYLARTQDPDAADREPAARVLAEQIHTHAISGYPDFVADLIVDSVSLTYSDAAEPALIGASLVAPTGTSVALVGSTGAGKSTLADVILGVLEPDSGSVTISGLSPRAAIDKWPGAISYVPQAVALVAGSVRENVALGMPHDSIDDELVWDALRRAHLDDFLVESRDGLETMIGERGFRLSGGQRQRLGIARALYTRPKLLVLDEATSALDAETEQAIIKTLQELEGEVTTITVAHRLATVRFADQVLYLENGRVSARGKFDEVRAQVTDFDRQASLLGL